MRESLAAATGAKWGPTVEARRECDKPAVQALDAPDPAPRPVVLINMGAAGVKLSVGDDSLTLSPYEYALLDCLIRRRSRS